MVQPNALAEPTFVGRQYEIEKLKQSLERTLEGKGSTIFISGKAGSGKTRLINEFLNTIQKNEINLLSGWCLSNASLPYFPFIEAFSNISSSNESETIVNQKLKIRYWLSEAYQAEEVDKPPPPLVWKDQAFLSALRELLFLSSIKPIIIVLEDMHWADSASLALLHYISRAINTEKILILVSYRTEELDSDFEGHPHQLVETIHLMSREGLHNEIELNNLSQKGIKEIAESMLNGKVNLKLVDKLYKESQGNPLFVVELIRMLSEEGNLVKELGQWQILVDKIGIPTKVRDIIQRRICALKPDQRRVLEVASIIGDKFNPDLIGAVLSKDRLEILEVLNRIFKSTSLVKVEGNVYSFDHAMSRDAFYEEISLPLKQAYHEKIAEEIEKSMQKEKKQSYSDIAYHYIQAGNKEKSVKYSLAAGQNALSRFSNAEAIKHFIYVQKFVLNNDELNIERDLALEGQGDALLASNLFNESMKVYKQLADMTKIDGVKLRAFRKAMYSAFQLGDTSQLMDLIEKAEPFASANRLEYARILVSRGRAFHLRSMLLEATKDMEKALQIFEELYSLRDVGWALIGLGAYHTGADKPQKGLAESLRSIGIFEELGDRRWQTEAYYVAGMAFNFCFLEQKALEMFSKVSDLNNKEKMGDFLRLVYANSFSSRSFESIGNLKKALVYSLKALKASKKTDSLLAKGVVYSDLTRQYSRLGMIEQAEKYFEKLMQIPPKILVDPRTIASLAKPAFYAGKNQWSMANEHFARILEGSDQFNVPEFIQSIIRAYYAWAIKKQGFSNEPKRLLELNLKKRHEIEMRFENIKLCVNFMVPPRVNVNQEFKARLDIVNVSRCSCNIKSIDNFMNKKLKVVSIHSGDTTDKELVNNGKYILNPFQIITITINFQAKYSGEINLNPKIVYLDDFGKTRVCNIKMRQIVIEPIAQTIIKQVEFRSDYAQEAFNFLIKAFLEDYQQHHLPLEKSGWRTLMEIVKCGHVSKHGMYGRSGKGGKITSELEQSGIVESRIFLGERGRGGRILKLRIFYEKEIVKQILNKKKTK